MDGTDANDTAKYPPVRVFGLNTDEQAALRGLARQRFGKASLSLLAKKLLQAELQQPQTVEPLKLPPPKCARRITLRLPDKDRAYLEAAAAVRRGSINDVVRDIIQSHIYQHPMISAHEADALYQSNYQLLTIGRNLNQIARRLNAGENASLTWQRHCRAQSLYRRAHKQSRRRIANPPPPQARPHDEKGSP